MSLLEESNYLWLKGRTRTATFTESLSAILKSSPLNSTVCLSSQGGVLSVTTPPERKVRIE